MSTVKTFQSPGIQAVKRIGKWISQHNPHSTKSQSGARK